jgi:CheY-like chemotaxis protein
MTTNGGKNAASRRADLTSDRTSELNNLLQIISGTSELIGNLTKGNEGCAGYMEMLRDSIDRAGGITAQLVRQVGGCDKKVLLHPDFSGLIPPKPVASQPGRKRSLLVVDDEPMALILAKQVLSQANYHVTTACSGFECLDLCRSQPNDFHLVVLDLTMPVMDGEEIFDRLREICPELPIVISTGFIAQEKVNRMLAAGLAGFIRKPLPPDEYVGHIRSILEKGWDAEILRSRRCHIRHLT